ncbi:hypothetical protein SAMN05660653_02812 [Desulfonatronum thiosulfatophilum]|uniref:N-acetyltransferase domain-containing protein n=1 Tax=Desulfonatronum thiosulfatophilum TaxID=617002 RepID=A0A1G6EEX3_9BACT|nr:hypothetical protein [Desulfonatronum thiosulfatophilum]SDB55926.1 hypothetical protein SAMN05660653_02812 [Desulfonatronum thiosulfatophilum]
MTDIIRVESQGQIRDVVNLSREIWTEHYVSIVGQEQIEYMLDKFQSAEAVANQLVDGYEYYTVSHDGEIQGYMAIVPEADTSTVLLSKIRPKIRAWPWIRTCDAGVYGGCLQRSPNQNSLVDRQQEQQSFAGVVHPNGVQDRRITVQDIGGGFVMDDYRIEKAIDQPSSGHHASWHT